jgi:hypothetical protein
MKATGHLSRSLEAFVTLTGWLAGALDAGCDDPGRPDEPAGADDGAEEPPHPEASTVAASSATPTPLLRLQLITDRVRRARHDPCRTARG